MPDRDTLPDGPLRTLVQQVHDLYESAGLPGVRQISSGIRNRQDLRDTVSHETVSSILRGDSLPRWVKLECVVRQLAAWAVTQPDPDAEVRRFHRLWLDASNPLPARAATPPAPARRGRRPRTAAAPTAPAQPRHLAHAPISNLPARNLSFVGRQALLGRMHELLEEKQSRPIVVRGIGGVGKTQLAAEFAHRHADAYDVTWWVPAEEPAQARSALAALAERLDLPRSQDLNQTARAALDALENSGLRWLLIFDNADEPGAVRAVLPTGGKVIVTTRTLGWSAVGTLVEATVFERPESIELLCRRGSGIRADEADLLAAQLGDLPLALEQVAAVQSATGMSATDYLRLFEEHVDDLVAGPRPSEYPTSVSTFVTLAVDRLRTHAPAAAQLLELFAFLGSEPVAVSLLRAGREADIEPPLGRALFQYDFIERVVGQLVRYGVARLEPHDQRIQVHRLVRAVLRERLDAGSAARVRETTHRLLGAANPGNPDDPRTWSLHTQIGPHLGPSGAVHSRDLKVLRAVVDQIRFLERRGEYEESRRLGESAVQAWRRPESEGGLGPQHELTLRAIRELANVLRALGSYHEARKITEEALARLRSSPLHGDYHPSTLDLAGAVGIYLRITGAYREALAMDRDVVARRLSISSESDPATVRAVGNLAVSLRMNGDFAEAYTADLQARDAFAQQQGPDHPRTLLATGNLARDLYGLGRYAESLKLISEILPKQIALHGRSHEYVLQSTRMMAIGLRKTGRLDEAESLAGQNFRDCGRYAGPDHENTLLSMVTFANCVLAVDDALSAKALASEALARYRSVFGPRHPVTLAAATNFAIVLRACGDRNEAYSIDQLTVRELEHSLGGRHPYTLAATAGLAADLALHHEPEAALTLGRDLVVRASETLGPDHPTTAIFQANLGLQLLEADHPEGLDLLRTLERDVTGRVELELEPPES